MIEKELLKTIRHVALATVNEDGSPHNTPLFFALDEELSKLYFVSRLSSVHSANILRTGKGFVALYDSNTFKGGIYLTLENGRIANGDELEEGLQVYNEKTAEFNIDVLPDDYHLVEDGYKLFICDVAKIEVYTAEEDVNGHLIKETRKEVKAEDLLDA